MQNTNVVIFSQMKRFLSILIAASILTNQAWADGFTLKTVVIDAGHGGKDPGCVSKDRKLYEKNVTLDIARKLRDKIREAYPDVKVVLTRDSDRFVELGDRAAIANKAGANLFISIHINASRNTAANGYSVHVLGQSSKKNRDLFAYNMDVVQRENAVMMLEDDYTTKYADFDPDDTKSFIFLQLMQNANLEQSLDFAQTVMDNLQGGPVKIDRGIWQDPFYVLWKTSMPAVLVELGFISNATESQALKLDGTRDELAGILFKSFCQYKSKYDGSVSISSNSGKDNASDAPVVTEEPQMAPPKITPAVPEIREESKPVEAKPAESKTGEAKTEGKNSEQKNLFPGMKTSPTTPSDVKTEVDKPEQKPVKKEQAASTAVKYGIQVFASSKNLRSTDPVFMGYKPAVYNKGINKYIVCISPSLSDVKKKFTDVKKKFKDAFIVRIEGENLYIEK